MHSLSLSVRWHLRVNIGGCEYACSEYYIVDVNILRTELVAVALKSEWINFRTMTTYGISAKTTERDQTQTGLDSDVNKATTLYKAEVLTHEVEAEAKAKTTRPRPRPRPTRPRPGFLASRPNSSRGLKNQQNWNGSLVKTRRHARNVRI